jgi:PII-like signaling protein
VNEDCLKLTTYFGERHRTVHGLVADELLDLYGRREVQISVLLRGVEGFGRGSHLRTDRFLSLSEDLPVVSVAVDTRQRIFGLLDELLAIKRHGLVTLERARMLSGRIGRVELPQQLHEATKLTAYVGRQELVDGVPAFVAVCALLRRRGLAGATILLGVDGTVRGARQRARFIARNANVPMMIIAVGSDAVIESTLPELAALLEQPLITLERVRICKRDGERLAPPQAAPAQDESGLPIWQKLMVYSSEQAGHGGSPLHVALVRALREAGAAGASCLRGVWGFHGDHDPHGDRLMQFRRRVPVVTVAIDSPERIGATFEIVDRITGHTGLVTSELVPAAVQVERESPLGSLWLARPGAGAG